MATKRFIEELRAQGIPLFPCCPCRKKPLTPHGYKDATTDKAQIRAWWDSWPDAMAGMPTGTVTGVWVLDVDVAKDGEAGDGHASLTELIAKHGPLPSTRTHATPSGGEHLLFKYPVGKEVRNSASKIAPHLDVRGEGGYIIIPPSVNSDGGRYTVVGDCDTVDAPEWLLDLVTGKKPSKVRNAVQLTTRLAEKTVLGKKLEELATARPGTRNETLASISYYCGYQIAAGVLSEEEARQRLVDACDQNGLWDEERDKTEQTITSGLEKGMEGDGRPIIIWADAQQHEVIRQVAEIITGQALPFIYRHATGLVYVGEVESAQRAGLQIYSFSWRTLQTALTAMICWKKYNAKGELVETKCPTIVAENLIEMRGTLRGLPHLEGITNTPIMRLDGSISTTPGYDAQTGLYFDPGNNDWPEFLDKPTLVDARRAHRVLRDELLKDFPFQEDHHYSVAVSMILTAITRHLFGTAPFLGLSSRMAGTGKTLLARIMAILATGRDISAMPLPKHEEELQKVITSVLRKRQPILLFDNISRPVGGDTLCMLLTSETFQGRLLGTNNVPHFPTKITLVATGINLRINGDLTRRCLLCEMDAGIEHPEEREFDVDIIAYTRENRVKLLTATFTMLRAFIQAKDKPKLSAFGSFAEWNSLVRGCLLWIGLADPLKSQEGIRADDPTRESLGSVLRAWRAWQRGGGNGHRFMTVKDALKNEVLNEILNTAIPHRAGELTAQHVGQWLSANKGNIVDGLFFEKAGTRKQAEWRVAKVGE